MFRRASPVASIGPRSNGAQPQSNETISLRREPPICEVRSTGLLVRCHLAPRAHDQCRKPVIRPAPSWLWCNHSSINKREKNETPHERLLYGLGVGRWIGAARRP